MEKINRLADDYRFRSTFLIKKKQGSRKAKCRAYCRKIYVNTAQHDGVSRSPIVEGGWPSMRVVGRPKIAKRG